MKRMSFTFMLQEQEEEVVVGHTKRPKILRRSHQGKAQGRKQAPALSTITSACIKAMRFVSCQSADVQDKFNILIPNTSMDANET